MTKKMISMKQDIPPPPIADAPSKNWVDRYAPLRIRPYLHLGRYDRPIGFWLLALPGLAALALMRSGGAYALSDLRLACVLIVGSVIARSAGCIYNDIADRDLDAKVARTAGRPLAAGHLTPGQAFIWLCLHLVLACSLLPLLPDLLTRLTALASIPLVALYPFMKRFFALPQAWLGLVFSWGALVAGVALDHGFTWPVLCFYASMFFWILGYDTIYARQDLEDDALIGVHSGARLFGEHIRKGVAFFYVMAAGLAGLAAFLKAGLWGSLAVLPFALHLLWQVMTVRFEDSRHCLAVFCSNQKAGVLLLLGFGCVGLFNGI